VVLFEWVECSNWGWWTVGARKNQIWASRVDRADQGRVLRPYIGKGSGRGVIGHRLGRGGGEKPHPLKPEGAAPRRRVRGNLSLASLEWVWESEAIVGVGGRVK
jgi:hypothetical protein